MARLLNRMAAGRPRTARMFTAEAAEDVAEIPSTTTTAAAAAATPSTSTNTAETTQKRYEVCRPRTVPLTPRRIFVSENHLTQDTTIMRYLQPSSMPEFFRLPTDFKAIEAHYKRNQ
ncbi:PREDICTED: uncharacterized protein LOC108569328 [Nicrophorus vespilloides]|uniref:Uncharacterized protein LOC108565192 n=1 Tax=Nicrophorus vespilloides TaxID=110193 RepID=A0ABM1MZJ6_NICVS|nr:PREDICTED: uncharacterized protein LOC108565192 [Nicrophorus vespilloides]XP_017779994.1 PREDICTED: uncharacterized protein LOC108565192 [Nicrophorus vespilloides]XP_017779996.1 PREDICTED: uncharacterized protein LOC108565192 [Nicrophorus vespilloides]XP_017786326.1 PREDICTED: uncharacterized protein LOC108569328 [Nicrophorus vespilloides]XP_017786328.1 PREDICTED: uncharacterized protein LOC108569328 [Nicrophorus vespilloides]